PELLRKYKIADYARVEYICHVAVNWGQPFTFPKASSFREGREDPSFRNPQSEIRNVITNYIDEHSFGIGC
ncbi:MAG: hypothetical protein QME81_15230, partial [bacterium]|nr:hypothetical protein [bacterium]